MCECERNCWALVVYMLGEMTNRREHVAHTIPWTHGQGITRFKVNQMFNDIRKVGCAPSWHVLVFNSVTWCRRERQQCLLLHVPREEPTSVLARRQLRFLWLMQGRQVGEPMHRYRHAICFVLNPYFWFYIPHQSIIFCIENAFLFRSNVTRLHSIPT